MRVHSDIKPENLLVVPDGGEDSALKAIDFGSSCDWKTPFKKGLRLATCDPIYTAPERRLDIFKPAFRFDVYSIALITMRVALPSLTDKKSMDDFVTNALAKGRFSLARTAQLVEDGRLDVSQSVKSELTALGSTANEDLFAVLCTMLTETPEERCDVEDCLNSRFVRKMGF